jgi:hypothetical protein
MRNLRHHTTNHKKCDSVAMTTSVKGSIAATTERLPTKLMVDLSQSSLCTPIEAIFALLPATLVAAVAACLHHIHAGSLVAPPSLVCQCLRLSFAPPAGCCIVSCCTISVSCCAAIYHPLDAWISPPPLIGVAASHHHCLQLSAGTSCCLTLPHILSRHLLLSASATNTSPLLLPLPSLLP